jgi:hypothetical protein
MKDPPFVKVTQERRSDGNFGKEQKQTPCLGFHSGSQSSPVNQLPNEMAG